MFMFHVYMEVRSVLIGPEFTPPARRSVALMADVSGGVMGVVFVLIKELIGSGLRRS